jgi:hypothetical protein
LAEPLAVTVYVEKCKRYAVPVNASVLVNLRWQRAAFSVAAMPLFTDIDLVPLGDTILELGAGAWSYISSMDFSSCSLGSPSAEVLSRCLPFLQGLGQLNLNHQHVGSDGCACLAGALASPPVPAGLHTVRMKRCGIMHQGTIALAAAALTPSFPVRSVTVITVLTCVCARWSVYTSIHIYVHLYIRT